MKPYFQDDNFTLYHGDARKVLPFLRQENKTYSSIITDPVWPNALESLRGSEDPVSLFDHTAVTFHSLTARVVVQLGCNSDPRFLAAISDSFPFFRVCSLEYVRPHYLGRLLYTGDIAYVFGTPPKSKPGAHLMPGRIIQTRPRDGGENEHPCPRRLQHVSWLVQWFGGKYVLDPFIGSGTTALACAEHGAHCTGVEIEERWCELAVTRYQSRQLYLADLDNYELG